jgi:hypothetical protein
MTKLSAKLPCLKPRKHFETACETAPKLIVTITGSRVKPYATGPYKGPLHGFGCAIAIETQLYAQNLRITGLFLRSTKQAPLVCHHGS